MNATAPVRAARRPPSRSATSPSATAARARHRPPSTASASTWPPARPSASSASPARASRRSARPSSACSRRPPGRSCCTAPTSPGRRCGSAGSRPIDLRVVFQDPYSSLNPAQTIGQTLIEPLRRAAGAEGRAAAAGRRRRWPRSACPPTRPTATPRSSPAGSGSGSRSPAPWSATRKVIVLDEPVSALDLSTQAQVLNLLADLRDARQLALLFIAHDLGVVRFLAQRVVVLYRGQVMEAGAGRGGHPAARGTPTRIALTAAAPVPQPAEQARAPRRPRGARHRHGGRGAARRGRLPVRDPLPARHRRLPHAAAAACSRRRRRRRRRDGDRGRPGGRLPPRRPGGRTPVAGQSSLNSFRG